MSKAKPWQYRKSQSFITSFWERTEKVNECLKWCGSFFANGYGQVKVNWKNRKAHRVAYELTFGEIPNNLCVLHHCDNKWCVNPQHLYAGTQKDNMADRSARGRGPVGEKNGNSKLSNFEIVLIQEARRRGESTLVLAERFDVDSSTIYYHTH